MKNSKPKKTNAAKPDKGLRGHVFAPGDKSMSHRALIFGALAKGTTKITGLLEGDDILHTAAAMRAFGAEVKQIRSGEWHVKGLGAKGWKTPKTDVDFGNAGTGARLVMGAASGFNIKARYTGDASLSSRPMGRVLGPLSDMGAVFKSTDGRLPISQIKGGALRPLRYEPPHASAQVKSAILLAGLNTEGTTEVCEPQLTRDHTENMLEAFGAKITRKTGRSGQCVSLTGPVQLKAAQINVPGDPSSAAFLIASALIVPFSDIIIKNVMMNPARIGLFEVLTSMGAFLRADSFKRSGGETIADIHVRHSKLHGVSVPSSRVPSMVDEYPILAVVAAFAKGTTEMRGLEELRVKECDRLAATHALLVQNGVQAEIKGDALFVTGGLVAGGTTVKTHHDHRIAMSALILGLGANKSVSIDNASMIATSFPEFFDLMASIGAPIQKSS